MKRLLPIMPLALAFSAIALGQLFPSTPAAGTTLSKAGLSVARGGGRTHMALNGVSFHETPDVISAARLIEVPQSTVCLVCWEQTAPDGQLTPYYAISLDGENMATVRPTSYELKLQHSQFDPLGRIPAVETDLAADEDSQIYIVQFVTQPLEQFRTAIEARGGKLYKYIANHAYLVKLGPQARQAVAALPFVRWLGPYHPAYRLEHFLRANRGDAGQLFPMQRYNILLFEREGAQDAVADRIAALGGEVNVRNAGRFLMQATLTPQQLFDVIRWDEVQFVDRWSPAEPDIDLIRADGGTNWVLLRRIQNVQPEWVVETIHLADFIPQADQVRLRFSVRDVPNNSVDEGGLDAVSIRGFNCTDGIDHGDLNCDGVVNVFDIDPFVLALTDAASYGAAYPACSILNADCNGDGSINVFDIDSFVQCLTSGC